MSNIEDDVKVLEKFMNNEMQRDKLERDNRCGGWKIGDIYKLLELNPAINNLLSERDQDKARIKELEENNRMLALEGSRVRLDLYIKQNYIPKQKVKEILDKAEVMDYYTLPDVIRDLEKLLEAEDEWIKRWMLQMLK
mgnify:CR=1 FL=1